MNLKSKKNLFTVMLSLLCAVLLAVGVGFALSKNQIKSANAAVAKNTNFTYAQVDARQYRTGNSQPCPTTFQNNVFSTTLNANYGVVDFTPASKTATVTKKASTDIVAGYVVFSASIDVPAMTEYNVTFSYDFTLVRTVASSSSTIGSSAELFFMGTTDTSSSLDFYNSDKRTDKSAPYASGLYWSGTGTATATLNDKNSKSNITFSNTTNSSKPFTVYFCLYGCGGRGTNYTGALDVTVVVSESVSITALTPPSVDIPSTPYNGNNQYFTFAYDNARTIVTKAEYTPNVGATQTLYDYDIVSDTVISGTNPLNASGVMEAKESGTYTVYFDILNDCGAVWNSTTDDQTTKSASFTITKKKLTVPTVSAPKQYTGAPQQFNLIDFNAGQDIKMDGVTAATSGQAVTDASGNTPTDTTGVFLATVVDKYTVMLTPRDTNNYEWDDATGGSGAKPVIFEITEKELLSSAPVSSAVNGIGDAEWQYGDSSVTMTVTDGRVSGESVNLLFYYDVVGGTSKSNVLTATTTGNTSVITMPANIPVGKYTLTVELDGATGNNANYKITTNNTLNFEVTSGTVDPSTYAWIYTKDGAAGSTIANNGKLPFELQAGSTVNGVKYELSIQIPAADASVVAEDTSKYVNGYLTRSGDKVGTFTTTVALKSIDPTFQFEVGGVKQSTTEVTLSWEIEKGTFDLSNVKWEYSLDGSAWADYDPANPPQYNDGNYITVRVKASTLPLGLTLDPLYAGSEEYNVSTTGYTATISASDLVYNTSNFNAPNTSLLNLNWEIAKKNLFTGFKNAKDTYSNSNGSGTIIIKQLNVPAGFESYITYLYYDVATGVPVTLADIKNAADPTHEKHYKVEAYIDPAFAANFEVLDNGSVPSDTFVTGSKNMLATVTIDGNDGSTPIIVDYDKNDHFDTSLIKVTGDDGINVTDFTVTYYNGKSPVPGNELAAGELPKNAGEYCIAVTLGTTAEKKYILATDWFTVKVEPKGIDIPTLGEMIFNGTELKFEDYLGGTWNDYNSIIKLDGKLSDRNVGAGDYVTTLELIDTNYKWIYPSSTVTTTKSIASYAFTAGGTSVTGDEVTATYNWNITPLVVDTTNMWNKGKTGATLNLPQNVKDLIAGGTLEVGYRYYDGSGNFLENPELKGGRSFKVEAVFGGDDAVRNVQFKTGDNAFSATSKSVDYTVPQGGAAAFLGNALSFFKSNWLWFLIGSLVLLFLIILIIVIAKRRKNKEEREEKKRKKEEEKERREEEKRRREEEREAARAKQQAELELAKAKQEAELAKMKAEAAAAAGIGAAGMAVAAQPQQQAVAQPAQQPVQPQPQPQVQYIQQPAADPNVLAEIKAELAEIKARQNIEQQYRQSSAMQMPMAQPIMQMPMQQPIMQMPMPMMQQPSYGPMPAYGGQGGGMSDPVTFAEITRLKAENEAHMKSELDRARTESERAKAEAEIAKIRAESGQYAPRAQAAVPERSYAAQPIVQPQAEASNGFSPEMLGNIIGGVLKGLNVPVEKQTVQKVTVEEQTKPATVDSPTVYPADAVVTTTTTIDTTKNKAQPRALRSDDGRLFDIDGFYDTFEGSK